MPKEKSKNLSACEKRTAERTRLKNMKSNDASNLPKGAKARNFRALNLISSEFKSTIVMALIIGACMAALSLISVFVSSKFNYPGQDHDDVVNATYSALAQSFTSVAIYSMIYRIRSVVRDKSTLDRNRAMFLTNKKEVVVFSKVLVDLWNFMLPVLLVMIIGLPVIQSKGGIFGDGFAVKMVAFVFALMFTYLISTFVMRWITSLEVSKIIMWLILGTWTLFTLLWMVGGGIAFGILGKTTPAIGDFFKNNEIWFAFIPIMNMVTPFMVLYENMSLWTVAPLIGEALIALIILWRPVSGILKTYLTT